VQSIVTLPEAAALRVDLEVFGTGAALPGPAVGTAALLQRLAPFLAAADAALAARMALRLGVQSRHVSRDFQHAAEAPRAGDDAANLAARAVAAALEGSAASVADLRFLIGHTATPHTSLPANIAWVADVLGYAGPHLELRQACTGFASAALTAASLCGAGLAPIAIVGSESGSCLFDPEQIPTDRTQLINLVQMGDGAGCIVIGPPQRAGSSRIEFVFYGCRGLQREPGIWLPEGGSGSPRVSGSGVPQFQHRYEIVREHGLDLLRAGMQTLHNAGFEAAAIDWWIPHQANGKMAQICAQHLQLATDQIVCDAQTLGNLGSAAIWVSLDRLRRSGRLRRGQRVAVLGAEASKFMYGGLVYRHGED
jgi:3-oxoacyl-[acyl-carrier-protein] synthase III